MSQLLKGFVAGYVAGWKTSPVICGIQLVLSVMFWVTFFRGKRTVARFCSLYLVRTLLGVPFFVYYVVSGKYMQALDTVTEELTK